VLFLYIDCPNKIIRSIRLLGYKEDVFVKTQKSKLPAMVSLVLAAVLVTGASLSVFARSGTPLIDQSYGVELQAKDSSAANVEINEIMQQKEIPASPALELLKEEIAREEAAAPKAQAQKEAAPEKTPEETAGIKTNFESSLSAFMAGGQNEKFEEFLSKKYENPTIVSLLDFSEYLMGPANPVKSIVDIIDYLQNGVNDMRAAMEPMAGESVISELYVYFTDDEGTLYTLATGVYWDSEQMLLYGKDEKGLFALGYDADVKNLMLYTSMESWQRNFGFMLLYDILSPLISFHYVTVRVRFSCGGYDWMVQLWKGRYIVGSGCEIGLYYKEPGSLIEFYNTAQDSMLIPMSMELYLRGKMVLQREHEAHWWLAGFVLPNVLNPSALTMKGSVTFQTPEMAKCFADAAKDARAMCNVLVLNFGSKGLQDITTASGGKKVSFVW